MLRELARRHVFETWTRSWLGACATAFRYATSSGRLPIAPDEAKLAAAISEIERVLTRLCEHFGVDLDEQDTPARNATPMRAR